MSELPPLLLAWYQKHGETAPAHELIEFDRLQMGQCLQCQFHGIKLVPGTLYRMNTRYENELSNWTVECEPCREETRAYWQERWDEYYSSVM